MKKTLLTLFALIALLSVTVSGCAAEKKQFGNFTANDINGNQVTQEVFAQSDLTMINIWATFCGPCLREMPELGEIASEYNTDSLQIIGIVADAEDGSGNIDQNQLALAKEIVSKTNANYLHLLPSSDLKNNKLNSVSAVPETIFVDRAGNIVGQSYVGSRDKAAWISIIEQTRKSLNN